MDRRQLHPSNSSCIAGEIVNVMSRTYTKPYKTHPNPLHLVESMSPHHLPHQATHGLLYHLHTSLVHLGILKCLEEFLPTQHLTRTLYFGAFVGPKKVVLKLCIYWNAALEAGTCLVKRSYFIPLQNRVREKAPFSESRFLCMKLLGLVNSIAHIPPAVLLFGKTRQLAQLP